MNQRQLVLRVRSVIAQWFVLFIVATIAMALFGGWMIHSAYAESAVETEEQTYEAWSTVEGFQHSADVQMQNLVYDVGETLNNQDSYFIRITPELEGEFEHRYEADRGSVNVTITLDRIIRAEGSDGETYWAVTEPINESTAPALEPGETHSVPFEMDVAGVSNETEMIETSLGGSPGEIVAVVRARVTVDGTIAGETARNFDQHELVIDPDEPTYEVDGPHEKRQTTERVEEHEVEPSQSSFGPLFGFVLLVSSIGALGTVSVAKYKNRLAPSERERTRVRLQHERHEFNDWITTGLVPEKILDRSEIEVDDLEGLVDIAIDCDRRVIEHRSGQDPAYYVVDGDLLYVYSPQMGGDRSLRGGATSRRESADDGNSSEGSDSVDGSDRSDSDERPADDENSPLEGQELFDNDENT